MVYTYLLWYTRRLSNSIYYVYNKVYTKSKFIKAVLYLTMASTAIWFRAWVDFNTVGAWTAVSLTTATERPQSRNRNTSNRFIACEQPICFTPIW